MTLVSPFKRFLGASAFSVLGDRFGELALPLIVLAVTGKVQDAGVAAAVGQLPPLLAGLFVGDVVDRRRRLPLLVTSDLIRALALGALAAWVAVGGRGLVPIIAVALVVGLGDVTHSVASSAYLPEIVSDTSIVAANS